MKPFFRFARRGRCAWLLMRMGVLRSRSQGRPPNPPYPLRSAWRYARLGLLGRRAWLSSTRGRAVLCLSRGRPLTPLLRRAWLFSVRGRAALCRCQKRFFVKVSSAVGRQLPERNKEASESG
jgi:hypothetical protein